MSIERVPCLVGNYTVACYLIHSIGGWNVVNGRVVSARVLCPPTGVTRKHRSLF